MRQQSIKLPRSFVAKLQVQPSKTGELSHPDGKGTAWKIMPNTDKLYQQRGAVATSYNCQMKMYYIRNI